MAANLRGPDKSHRDCGRCHFRKQTCDRKLPQCTRCTVEATREEHACNYHLFEPKAAKPQGPLVHWLNDRWRMTDHGREQFGQLILAGPGLFTKVPEDLKNFVQTLISDQGCTIDELLKDNIFKWFPIVEPCYMDSYAPKTRWSDHDDPDRFLPLLHMAILLVTSSPAVVIEDGSLFHTDLYKSIEALVAVVSANVEAHFHIIQALGLIALYEFGQGCYEHAHITLTSAFGMANVVNDYTVDMEAQLTWKLCLMTLDRMIAMSTHSRLCEPCGSKPAELPLACPSHHSISKEVDMLVDKYSCPQYTRNSEEAITRIHAMYKGVKTAGRIMERIGPESDPLHRYADSQLEQEEDDESEGQRIKSIDKDKRDIMDDRGNPKVPDYWSGHDPQVLSLSAMLVHEYHARKPEHVHPTTPRDRWDGEWRERCEDVALKACTTVAIMSRKEEVDIRKLSMVSMFCLMHNVTIIIKDFSSDFAIKEAKTFRPVMKNFAARWPFADNYLYHLNDYIDTAEHLHEVRVYE